MDMEMQLHFNYYLDLNKSSKNPEKIIFLHVRNKSKIFFIHTGERIQPKYWDVKKQQPKRNYPGKPELTNYLDAFKNHVKKIIREIKAENPFITFYELKKQVNERIKEKSTELDFFDVFDNYLSIKEPTVSKAFMTKYRTLKTQLMDFEDQKPKDYKIRFDSIDLKFFDELHGFYLTEKKLSNNTIRKNIQYIKTFLRYAVQRGYTENTKFENYKNIKQHDTDNFSLTIEELKRLKEVKLTERYEKTRDLFLFQVYTGQRYSDIKKFDIEDVKNDTWYLTQTKTKKTIEIPLSEPAIEILNKYAGNLPLKAMQKVNNDLKVIGELAQIDDVIKVKKYFGSEMITEKKKKFQLLSTHVARRTFVTILSNANINQQVIKSFTGHGTDKMLSKYYKSNADGVRKAISGVFNN